MAGDVYLTDNNNGNGTLISSGDGNTATTASLQNPNALWVTEEQRVVQYLEILG
eukprot:gene38515-47562_t